MMRNKMCDKSNQSNVDDTRGSLCDVEKRCSIEHRLKCAENKIDKRIISIDDQTMKSFIDNHLVEEFFSQLRSLKWQEKS